MPSAIPGLSVVRLPVLALALAALAGCGPSEPAPPPRPAVVVQPTPAGEEALAAYPATLKARHEHALGFRVGGKVVRRRVEVGQRVTAGQVLVELDPADLELELGAATAALASAEADAALAASELSRHEELAARGLVSRSALDARRNADAAARARVRQAEARLAAARNAAGYAKLGSPVDGVVVAAAAEPGQVVAAGQPVVTVADTGEIEAEIHVPESRIANVAVGASARIALWADEDVVLAGRVREIAPEADPRARTYAVRIAIGKPPARVQLGMTARAMLVDRRAAAITVPITAVTETDGRPSVWRVDRRTATVSPVPVTVREWGADTALLEGGIDVDDWIVAVGVHRLTPGQPIRPIDRRNRAVSLD